MFAASLDVDRPPQVVWDAMDDINNTSLLFPLITSQRVIEMSQAESGGRLRRMEYFTGTRSLGEELLEDVRYEPPTVKVTTEKIGGALRAVSVYRVTPRGPGATMSRAVALSGRAGLWRRILGSGAVADLLMQRQMALGLRRLRASMMGEPIPPARVRTDPFFFASMLFAVVVTSGVVTLLARALPVKQVWLLVLGPVTIGVILLILALSGIATMLRFALAPHVRAEDEALLHDAGVP